MKFSCPAAALAATLVIFGGCAHTERLKPVILTADDVESLPPTGLEAVIKKAPDLAWTIPNRKPESKYLYFPGVEYGAGFYLTENGFHSLEPDNFALRYDKTEEGFRMVEVKKRQALTHLPECPVFLPADRCIEDHALMLATEIECTDSCTYRFVIFDYFDPVFVLRSNPTIIAIMRNLVEGTPTNVPFDIKHEENGKIPNDHRGWANFIQTRFDFIMERIKVCEKVYDLKFINPVHVSEP